MSGLSGFPRWRWWAAAAVVVLASYFPFGGTSPLTQWRVEMLGERICRMARDGAFDLKADRYLIPDLQPTGPGLTAWLHQNASKLKRSCVHIVENYAQIKTNFFVNYFLRICEEECIDTSEAYFRWRRKQNLANLYLFIYFDFYGEFGHLFSPWSEMTFSLRYHSYSGSR